MTTILPSPGQLLGLPPDESDGFSSWYPGQDYAVSAMLDWLLAPGQPRFMCATLPTGSGKTLASAICSQFSNMRAAVLTSTKGLQDQFITDFHRIGFRDIRGQNSYPCILLPEANISVDEGPCHAGATCPHRDRNCIYYSELAKAAASKFVVTNYAFWLTQANTPNPRGSSIGRVGLITMDEADDAFGAIESHLSTHISVEECRASRVQMPERHQRPETWRGWQEWAHHWYPRAEREERNLRERVRMAGDPSRLSKNELNRNRQVRNLKSKLALIQGSLGEWVWRTTGGGRGGGGFGILFTPVWPGLYSNLIFGNAQKVLVMSATLTPKTADLLNIPEDDRRWLDVGSTFSPSRSPIQHIRTVRVDHRATDTDMRAWVNRIDQIIDRRLDRKGLILPVSYDRGEFIYRNTRHRDKIIIHNPGEAVQAVERWRKSEAPKVLISPSVARGWDFPGDDCRYIVIGKMPFSDGRDPVNKARNDHDPEFSGYETMQSIVQQAGRGTRSPEDWCETLIIDDHWSWMVSRNGKFAPKAFMDRLRKATDVIPEPPPLTGYG